MSEERRILPVLAAGHLLLLVSLFSSGGVHQGTLSTFASAPVVPLGYLPFSVAQGLIFLLGLIAAAVPFKRNLLLILLIGESYFVTIDPRMAGRFWFALTIMSLAYVMGKERWSRVAFLCWPASGPYGLLALILLKVKDLRVLIPLLWFQGHQIADFRWLLVGWALTWALYEEPVDATVREVVAGIAVTIASVLLWTGTTTSLQIEFLHQGTQRQLTLKRQGAEVTILADDNPLGGPWYEDGDLLLNPLFFTEHPQRLDSRVLLKAYEEELNKRHGVTQFKVK